MDAPLPERGGAGLPGFPERIHPALSGLFWFGLKMSFILFVYIWLRGTFPRYRYDQLMRLGWKWLIPLSMANVLATGLVMLLVAQCRRLTPEASDGKRRRSSEVPPLRAGAGNEGDSEEPVPSAHHGGVSEGDSQLAPRFRGVPRLRRDPEKGEELCIACLLCEQICPDDCISIVSEKKPDGKGKHLSRSSSITSAAASAGCAWTPARPSRSPPSTCPTTTSWPDYSREEFITAQGAAGRRHDPLKKYEK